MNATLVTGLNNGLGPADLTVFGGNLYVAYDGDRIGEFDATTGAPVNATLISGLDLPSGVVVVPEPSTWMVLTVGALVILIFHLASSTRTLKS